MLSSLLHNNYYWLLDPDSQLISPNFSTHITEEHWFLQQDNTTLFNYLSQHPAYFKQALQSQKNHRLGYYYERLWWAWLQHNPRYQVLAHNIPLRDAQRTLGELDFIVLDRKRQHIEHWEVAVKFYLGVGDTQHLSSWHGIGLRDRLDRKLHRMCDHQLPLLFTAAGQTYCQQQQWQITQQRLILQGRLFYPFATLKNNKQKPPIEINPTHHTGFWASRAQVLEHCLVDKFSWVLLSKEQWLAPITSSTATGGTWEQLIRQLNQAGQRECCVAQLENGKEVQRGFILPDEWEQQALAISSGNELM